MVRMPIFTCSPLQANPIRSDKDIHRAVKMWCRPDTHAQALAMYGEIGAWKVDDVTNMEGLFSHQEEFNDNISGWNTGNVTTMSSMFDQAKTFNQPVEGLNTSKVTDMSCMFSFALKFNQPVEGLDTANVTDMSRMFKCAFEFRQPVDKLNTSSVTEATEMFKNAGGACSPGCQTMYSTVKVHGHQPGSSWN